MKFNNKALTKATAQKIIKTILKDISLFNKGYSQEEFITKITFIMYKMESMVKIKECQCMLKVMLVAITIV